MLSYGQPASLSRAPSALAAELARARPASSMSDSTLLPSPGHDRAPTFRHIWIITGPAGCGKSTIAQHLAQQLSLPYIEGDEYHPPANIEKMASGTPLTDADRWDWLIALRDQSLTELQQGATGVVLTCSALKKKYRDVIRIASYNDHAVRVHFVYLRASQELLLQRVKARQGHYMKDSMVKSQFSSLEEPRSDETDCLILDVSRTLLDVQSLALDAVKRALLDDDIHDT